MKYLLILITLLSLVGCAENDEDGRTFINAKNLYVKCSQDQFSSNWIIDKIKNEYIWIRSVYKNEKDCTLPLNLINQFEIYVVQEE